MAKWQDEQVKAIREAGLIRGVDIAFFVIFFTAIIVGLVLLVVTNVTASGIVVYAVSLLVASNAWLVLLVYRCMMMVLLARADINLIPANSADIVRRSMLQGGR
jgi:hypothetical protein